MADKGRGFQGGYSFGKYLFDRVEREVQEEYQEAVKQYEAKTGKRTTRSRSTIPTKGEFDLSF